MEVHDIWSAFWEALKLHVSRLQHNAAQRSAAWGVVSMVYDMTCCGM